MRRTIIAFLALMLLALTLGASTFAWISIARTSQIESITLIATLGDKLEISLDGETYYKDLPAEEMAKVFKKIRLLDVTTTDGKTFTHIKDNVIVEPNSEYISVDFYFRTESIREKEVYLANNISNEVNYSDSKYPEGTFIVSRGVAERATFDFQYGPNEFVQEGEVRVYHASDAIRISTISEINNEEVVKIFDLSGNEERGYGKPYGAYDYYNKRAGKMLSLPTEIPPTIYELSKFHEDAPFSYDHNSKLLDLKEEKEFDGKTYYIGKITMNIWLEGWDADSFDPVTGDRIKIQLQFKAVRNQKN
ncbi:MAG: hypothetical protein GX546_04415 [Acholeplasmataceae bacterium]|jgi:hypothetical protein|nr:hypothetical protein [Acholeplasmataceae bacterium]